jgi:hypothetical protein
MSQYSKKTPRIDKVLEDAKQATSHGGQLAVDAIAKDFGLWKKIAAVGAMDRRKDKKRGFAPEAVMAQFIFSLCSGGISLADAGRLGGDPALGKLLGMERWADESTLGEWLRGQGQESLGELWRINRELVAWVLGRAKSARVRHAGQLEVFFDDTQIEVEGRKYQGTEKNYEGALSYSWQTLWVGPFVADAEWSGGNRAPSDALPALLESADMLTQNEGGKVHFYADSASSAGKYLEMIGSRPWSWTVSYNKWVGKLEALAEQMGESEWSPARRATGRKGQEIEEQHGWIRHLPGEECQSAQSFAVVRYRDADGGDMFWRYGFVVCGGSIQKDKLHDPSLARFVFERHHLKGAKEQGFHQLLGQMDLHHPPCLSNQANAFYYAIGALAFNLLMAVKVLLLEDDQQSWGVRSIIRFWLTVPVKISSHAHRIRARLFVPKASLRWWRLFLEEHYPKRKPGRPLGEPDLTAG